MWYQKCNSEMLYVGSVLKLALIQHRHFHPSSDITPSKQDLLVTEKIAQAGKMIGVELLDHIIIGGNEYCSLKELGVL